MKLSELLGNASGVVSDLIQEFNPYHDAHGRFTSRGGGGVATVSKGGRSHKVSAFKRETKFHPVPKLSSGTREAYAGMKKAGQAVGGGVTMVKSIKSGRDPMRALKKEISRHGLSGKAADKAANKIASGDFGSFKSRGGVGLPLSVVRSISNRYRSAMRSIGTL